MIEIKWKKVHPEAKCPTKSYSTDACFDLYVVADKNFIKNEAEENIFQLEAEKSYTFNTGIQVDIPKGWGLFMWDRSSLGTKNIHRFAGVIDTGYLGNIFVHLYNLGKHYYKISEGDRIAQAYVAPIFDVNWTQVKSLKDSKRGKDGFGSTGR